MAPTEGSGRAPPYMWQRPRPARPVGEPDHTHQRAPRTDAEDKDEFRSQLIV
jgi:hypothetical protein